ncbi:hypothetical protein AAFF_G00105040 [Aldrovandia affinis]|uniref:Uncharacterized protein n=1 Tax=Aldrovandia affinis TaxID=143900 RepID=A0AAD7T1Y4_9TELE|nr:hypothetical protein AAFF_G00105040 [Aldrovandia affinis]
MMAPGLDHTDTLCPPGCERHKHGGIAHPSGICPGAVLKSETMLDPTEPLPPCETQRIDGPAGVTVAAALPSAAPLCGPSPPDPTPIPPAPTHYH